MSAITFDTLRYAKTLRTSGIPEVQTEAMAQAQRESLEEALESQLATKADITNLEKATRADINRLEKATHTDINRLEKNMHNLETKITLVQWMLALVIVATVIPALKALL